MENTNMHTYPLNKYIELISEYYKLDEFSFKKTDTKDYVLEKLEDISSRKREIANQINTIINEYISCYEKDPFKLTEDECTELKNFINELNRHSFDKSIIVRITKLLKEHYKLLNDFPRYVSATCLYNDFNITLYSYHIVNYIGPGYPYELIEIFSRYDEIPYICRVQLILTLSKCTNLPTVFNEDDKDPLNDNWKIYDVLLEAIKRNKELMEKENLDEDTLKKCPLWYIDYALFEIREKIIESIESYYNNMNQLSLKPQVDNILPRLNEFFDEMVSVMEANKNQLRYLSYLNVCYSLMRWIGKITFDEFLLKLKDLRKDIEVIEDEATRMQFLAYNDYFYFSNLYLYSGLPKEKIKEISDEVVYKTLNDLVTLKHKAHNLTYDRAIMTYVVASSFTRDFNDFTNIILDLTVYSDKSLFIHTILVKEISRVIFDYLIKTNPEFFNGVCNYDTSYIKEHKKEIRAILDDCAMFHDIGKFAMFEIVENSMRKLTDEEFDIIKKHPDGFNDMYTEIPTDNVRGCCIKDVALTHHLWHDGTNGYPNGMKHTNNRPFSDILAIADSIDAATDFIGRPYNNGKNLDALLPEFIKESNTRYSGDVVKALNDSFVKERISYLISEGRKEINYQVYVYNKVNKTFK